MRRMDHQVLMQAKRHFRSGGIASFSYGWTTLRGDITGGLVASALIVPAALSFGELSGLGPVAGLYGALAIGIFGALAGNTRGIISGANSNVSIIMALVVSEYTHSIQEALAVAMLAGVTQILFGLLRIGRYISYLPISLLNGFFTGVGLLLIITQLAPAMGVANVSGGVSGALEALPFTIAHANLDAVLVTAICIAVVIGWRGPLKRFAQAQLMLLVAGVLAGVFWLRDAPAVGEINVGIPSVVWPEFSTEFLVRAVQPAFMIAMLSTMGLLVRSMLVESVTGPEQQTNRLLIGHGMGNAAAGLVGGLPGGAANGTLANALSGGRTLVSNLTVVSMVSLTLFGGLSAVIELIPKAVLASILIVTGVNIIDWRRLRRLYRAPMSFWLVMVLTTFLVLFVDVLTGLMLGFIVAMFLSFQELEVFEVPRLVSVPLLDREILGESADLDDPFGSRTSLVRFPDRVSVASAREIARIVGRDVGERRIVIFDFSRTEYVDNTAAVLLGTLINTASRGQSDYVISGMQTDVAERIRALGFLDQVPPKNLVPDFEAAKLMVRPMIETDIAGERSD